LNLKDSKGKHLSHPFDHETFHQLSQTRERIPYHRKPVVEKLQRKEINPNDFLMVIHPNNASTPSNRWYPEAWAKMADFLVQEHKAEKAEVVLNGIESER